MIKNMVMEYINGQMEEYWYIYYYRNMKVIGQMENNKEKEDIYYQMEKINKEYGIKEKELNG